MFIIEISTITDALVKNQCTEAAGAKKRAEHRNRKQLAIGWSRSRVEGWERAERMSVMCCGRLTAFVIVRRSFREISKRRAGNKEGCQQQNSKGASALLRPVAR